MLTELLDRLGVTAESDRAEILAATDGIADSAIEQMATALANQLPAGGVKDVVWGPIRSAVTGSVASDDAALNAKIAALFDAIVAKLESPKS